MFQFFDWKKVSVIELVIVPGKEEESKSQLVILVVLFPFQGHYHPVLNFNLIDLIFRSFK